MIKFGAVNIDISHPMNFAWALEQPELNGRAKYVAVYNDGFRGEEEVKAFASKNNLVICKTLEELADMVDVAFIHTCNWDKHVDYIKPFVERGVKVFVDKPIAGNMKDLRTLEEMVENGAEILGHSALRYTFEIDNFKAKCKEFETRPINALCTVGGDGFTYQVHAVEHLLGIFDAKPVSCKLISSVNTVDSVCDNYLIKFSDGAVGQYVSLDNKGIPFNTVILTETLKGGTDFIYTVDNWKIYVALLSRVCDYVDGKKDAIAPVKDLNLSIKIMLAGKASKENGGIEVALDSPLLETVSFDGYEYEKNYAAKAKVLYK